MDVKGVAGTDINAVLMQMRALRAQAGFEPLSHVKDQGGVAERKVDFGETLKSALNTVNGLQKTSSNTANAFMSGQHNDLVRVMVDSQKANLGFQGLVQVRNRMVSAYQDIMNMPI